jgi:hypothetical protein
MMRKTRQWIVSVAFLLSLGFVLTGCGSSPKGPVLDSAKTPGPVQELRISALTEFVYIPNHPQVHLKVMTELLDASEQPVRQPCSWRFELYDFIPRSSEPRGFRLMIWPDQDLTVSGEEAAHWKEFLTGYEFYLPLDHELKPGKKYVLEATAMTEQRRYNDLYEIKYLPQ